MKKPTELKEKYEYIDGRLRERANGYIAYGERTGYWTATLAGKSYQEHRLIWVYFYGEIPKGMDIDHIDGNRKNNKIENLRLATRSQNCINRKSKSGYKGVAKSSVSSRWVANIKVKQKVHYLGCYKTPEEAAYEYDNAALRFFGEFAVLNFPKVLRKPSDKVSSNTEDL